MPAAALRGEAIRIREARPEDAAACAGVIHAAFCNIAAAHGFPSDFPKVEMAAAMAASFIEDASVFAVVAEEGGRIVGVNFLHEGDRVRAVGPIAVDPGCQGSGIGRRLMQAVLHRAGTGAQVRLLQDAFNTRSMALYASLGFMVKEPVLLMAGMPRGPAPREGAVRRMRNTDIPACAALCKAVHGITRTHDLASPNPLRDPMVIERDGRITGYLTAPSVWLLNHGVAETPADMRGLIVGASAITRAPASLLLPARGNPQLEWALEQGLRVVKPMTLMARGAYYHPRNAWFPSVFY
jgi:ribosomal protein S18 acetylase RimI-like enzyme